MAYEYKQILVIEDATTSSGEFMARAIILHNEDKDTPDALCVKDILECANIDTLRDVVKNNHPDIAHYRVNTRALKGGWSEALKVAKDLAYEAAIEAGADVRKNMSLRHLAEHKVIAERAAEEKHLENIEREEKELAQKAAREARIEEREDFDAWKAAARSSKDDDLRDHQMAIMVGVAMREIKGWEAALAKHIKKVSDSPLYALSWSGDFVQTAANYEVSRHIVDAFQAGITFDDMREMATSELFRNAGRATSRSTSVMSNLTDDCIRVAWSEALQRIMGKSFW